MSAVNSSRGRSRLRDERGQAMILVALALVMLIGFVGFARLGGVLRLAQSDRWA